MEDVTHSFSERHGYQPADRPITVREGAPQAFRDAVIVIAEKCGLTVDKLRDIVCKCLLQLPDKDNWSPGPVLYEVQSLMRECDWWRVYDIVEGIDAHLKEWEESRGGSPPDITFATKINDLFVESGIGWRLSADGKIESRGDGAYESVLNSAEQSLAVSEFGVAQQELKEAIRCISRRPEPNLSGAQDHACAALESITRKVTGDSATLGNLMRRHPELFPQPLNQAVEKCWGYASREARHGKEDRNLTFEDTQLVVGLAAVLSTYLTSRLPSIPAPYETMDF